MSDTGYQNSDLEKMKNDIADRATRLKVINQVVSIATAAAGLVLTFMIPGMGGIVAGLAIGLGGPLISTLVTQREQEKLKIDQEYVQSYISGKNYWGEGYRKEVAEQGFAGPQVPAVGAQAPERAGQAKA